jgi:predicted unusual protein kinase regulating ubiquinone biosynthesis (AarF/ABC1/UbiB family)
MLVARSPTCGWHRRVNAGRVSWTQFGFIGAAVVDCHLHESLDSYYRAGVGCSAAVWWLPAGARSVAQGHRDGSQSGIGGTVKEKLLRELPTGFRGRTLKTAKLLTKGGLKLAKRNLMGATTRLIDEAAAVAAAERLASELNGLKGLVMKFGQMVSYLDHSLPPAAQKVLARLQSESQPMASDVVADIIAAELGGSPDQLFEGFEPTPFAAASIGQVHRARLFGKPVAIKVQYPGVLDALESDLKIVGRFARVGLMASAVDGKALVAELRDRIIEECDYTREARNQQLFHELCRGDNERSVPVVRPERSSRRVLTSELAQGRRFHEFVAEAGQEHRDRAGRVIFQWCFRTIFRHAVFNADPHPGNYLFGPEGEVTFLDFGCLKWFPHDLIANWKALARCLVNGDRAGFPDRFMAAGLVAKTKNFDWDYQWDAMRYLYQPFCTDEPSVYTGEFIVKSQQQMMVDNPNRFRLNLPRDWLFANRLQFGLLSVLAILGARSVWGRWFREALDIDAHYLAPPEAAPGPIASAPA